MGGLGIKNNIFLLTALTVIGLIAPAAIVLKSQILADKKEEIRNAVENAHSVVKHYYKLSKEGNISEDDAKAEALKTIKVRYSGKEYFWVNDTVTPYTKMLIHPITLNTMDAEKLNCAMSMQVEDNVAIESSDGKKNLFQAFAEVYMSKGIGFAIHEWTKPTDGDVVYPKLSYTKEFEEWGWIVGSGICIDDFNDAFMQTILKNLTYIIPTPSDAELKRM